MIFISYSTNNKTSWGLVDKENKKIYPAEQIFNQDYVPSSLLEYIQTKNKPKIIQKKDITSIDLNTVTILPPITKPIRNILCVGKNYIDHIIEFDKSGKDIASVMQNPVFFTKSNNSINGPFYNIPLHKKITHEIDYEAELAVIIGKKGINLKENEVMDYIFGYTILNDVTARDLQRNHKQWFKGKSLDGFCPLGPWIVTKDEINNPNTLKITSKVNGEIRQNSNTKNMIYNIKKLISILSQGFTLQPGDIIATGTPEGVGIGFNPPKFLSEGDIVKIEIEKIGYIENRLRNVTK